MSTPKEKQVIFEIIELYKNMPFLWDRNYPDYKNKYKRNNANQILLEVYKKLDENANLQMLTKKILNLRTNYYKELRKVKKSLANEADEQEVYEPTLWYFDALSFLGDNTSECCQSIKDPLKIETISPSTSDGEGSNQNLEKYSSPPLKRRKFTNPIVYKDTNNSNLETETAAENPPHMRNEECDIFGKAIGLQLRDLDKKQLTIAQKIISDAIYYAKFGLLSQKSYINLGTPSP